LITVKDIQKNEISPMRPKTRRRSAEWCRDRRHRDFLERGRKGECKVDLLAIDSAHGHSSRVLEAIKTCESKLPKVDLIAGNVGTFDGAANLPEPALMPSSRYWSGIDLHNPSRDRRECLR